MKDVLLFIALLAAGTSAAVGAGLDPPQGRVILTISGEIDAANTGDTATFDLAMLDAMTSRTTVAETPWYDETHAFEGALLSEVVAAVGAQGHDLRVTAVNGYEAVIPAADIAQFPIILATRIDGKTISVRDRGPVFIVYPFDLGPQVRNERYFARSVWQVVSMQVL
jgi:hypothetical protein